MGKKRTNPGSQQHASASFGQMVSRAALTQLKPDIAQMINQLGQQLAMQTAQTMEMHFSRIVVLETILMEKYGYTKEDLGLKFSDVEDQRAGREATTDGVTEKDLVRFSIQTRTKEQKDFQGISKMKMYNTGSGNTLGTDLEAQVLGMKAGETKETEFGENNELVAKIFVDRVSRLIPKAAPVSTPQGDNTDDSAKG